MSAVSESNLEKTARAVLKDIDMYNGEVAAGNVKALRDALKPMERR